MSCERIWPAGAREQCLLSMVIHCVESVRGGEKNPIATISKMVCLSNCAVFVCLVFHPGGSIYSISYIRTD